MHSLSPIKMLKEKNKLSITIHASLSELGIAAANLSTEIIRAAIAERGYARIMVATGNSQVNLIRALVRKTIDWSCVDAFHLDEYVGIDAKHPASFRKWVQTQFVDKVQPRSISYLNGNCSDSESEAFRYAELLMEDSIDLAFVGIGENGHIAFNDPHTADFNDTHIVKRVELDIACRQQQVREGHFPDIGSVPPEALTVTCPGLMRARNWVCSVPELRKAAAIRDALEGDIGHKCPGSLVRMHQSVHMFLDHESSSLLSPKTRATYHSGESK